MIDWIPISTPPTEDHVEVFIYAGKLRNGNARIEIGEWTCDGFFNWQNPDGSWSKSISSNLTHYAYINLPGEETDG